MGVRDTMKGIKHFYEELFFAPYRRTARREHRDEEDLFMLLVFSDMMGIPNPVFYYTLELYPAIYQRFHEWHLRMGMEKSPFDGMRCC